MAHDPHHHLKTNQSYEPPAGFRAITRATEIPIENLGSLEQNKEFVFWFRDGVPAMPIRAYGEDNHHWKWAFDDAGTYWWGSDKLLPQDRHSLWNEEGKSDGNHRLRVGYDRPSGTLLLVEGYLVTTIRKDPEKFFLFGYKEANRTYYVARDPELKVLAVRRDKDDAITDAFRQFNNPRSVARMESLTIRGVDRRCIPSHISLWRRRAGSLVMHQAVPILEACFELSEMDAEAQFKLFLEDPAIEVIG